MTWLRGEPMVEDMLCDPIIMTIMKRDGVAPDDLRALLQEMSRRLTGSRVSPGPSARLKPTVPAGRGVREHLPA